RAQGERLHLDIASKPESYEICFIPDNDYRRFLRDARPEIDGSIGKGQFMLDGKVVGEHEGYPFYTVGQRKGLGIAHSEPLYVLNVLPTDNIIELGTEDKLDATTLTAHSVNLQKYATLDQPIRCMAKIRYKDSGAMATCHVDADGTLHVKFDEPRKAIARGQSVVLYEDDDVIGGGIINGCS
ncbi:MAG: tRNA-specific 2-thiouridylase mnmA, partial [Bacteroidota bacterium]